MKGLEILELRRMMKELEFCESDYEFKNEFVTGAESEFMRSVNECLDEYPEMKAVLEEKMNAQLEESIRKKLEEEEGGSDNDVEELPPASPKMKKLYRDIVKKTHPDKVKDQRLNDFYMEATEAYDNRDLLILYRICGDLRIDYELSIEDMEAVRKKIEEYSEKIEKVESTYTWKWARSEEAARRKIVLEFIKAQMFG